MQRLQLILTVTMSEPFIIQDVPDWKKVERMRLQSEFIQQALKNTMELVDANTDAWDFKIVPEPSDEETV